VIVLRTFDPSCQDERMKLYISDCVIYTWGGVEI